MTATWISFPENNNYEVSSDGQIRNKNTMNIRKLQPVNGGRLRFEFMRASKRHHFYIDDVVSACFLGPKPENYLVRNKDGDKSNNKVDNLEYVNSVVPADNPDDWKQHPCSEFADTYEISRFGEIRNRKTGNIRKLTLSSTGYLSITCDTGSDTKSYDVHILVAQCFIGSRPGEFTINHKDGDKYNNRADNLEYISHSDNCKHAWSTGLREKTNRIGKKVDVLPEGKSYHNYTVTPDGHVFNSKTKRELCQETCSGGYKRVCLTLKGKRKHMSVHRLVSELFLDRTENRTFVNHIDGKTGNNCAENLEWCTSSENMQHAADTGKIKMRKVRQLDLQGNEIAVYPSVAEASRKTGTNNTAIIHVCAGRAMTSNGFDWEYID